MMESISLAEFHQRARVLVGLPVSKTWQGFGSAIFFEMGELHQFPRRTRAGHSEQGEFTLMIEWSWRVERPRSIYFGSESGPRAIAHRLQTLQGLVVEDISVDGRLPEVTLRLSGGHWVRSFSTVESQPEWCLFFRHPDLPRHSVSSSRGKLYIGTA